MAFDRRPILRTFTDKVAVRGYVTERVGSGVLNPVFAICDDVAAIPWEALPREFVIRASHASGANVIVDEQASPNASIPLGGGNIDWGTVRVTPEAFDRRAAVAILQRWCSMSFVWTPNRRYPEWAYGGIAPRLLLEPLLREADGGRLIEYRFYVFSGRCGLINCDRFDPERGLISGDLMTPSWQRLRVTKNGYPLGKKPPVRPAALGAMLGVAEALGEGIDFVRVDLFAVGERVVFGELTPYPTGGVNTFDPPSFDLELGALWRFSPGEEP